jgi:catechol 2,3-dioxygenase-like lactoylglutathione lyase family enzyme
VSEQLPIEAWDHVVIRVSNLEESKAFYEKHLGFKTEVEVEVDGEGLERILDHKGAKARLVMGRVGGELVELIEYQPAGLRPLGIAAFTLEISDADRAYAICEQAGIETETPPAEIHGSRQFFIRDPDGIRIELTQPPSED